MTLTGSFLRTLHHEINYRHTIDPETGFYLSILFMYCTFNVGSVKVWDPRQKGKPVATMEPAEGDARRDCWTVAFGNILLKSRLCQIHLRHHLFSLLSFPLISIPQERMYICDPIGKFFE